jgi:hypothetical protein
VALIQLTAPSPLFLDLFIPKDLRRVMSGSAHSKGLAGRSFPSLLTEAADKGKGIAKHGVVGTGMAHGSIDLTF